MNKKSAFRIILAIALLGAGGFYYYQSTAKNPVQILSPAIPEVSQQAAQTPPDSTQTQRPQDAPAFTVETPRTETPLGAYTSAFEKTTLPIGGRVFTYYSYTPKLPLHDGALYPLVVVLHGAPGNAYAAAYLAEPQTAEQFPAFILAPVLQKNRMWAWPARSRVEKSGLDATMSMIGHLKKMYPVDPARIYVIGCSDGGTGVFGAVRHYPDVFAAAVTISGLWTPDDAPSMTKTPLLAIHGVRDTVIPIKPARDTVAAIRANGGDAFFSAIDDMGHQCADRRFYSNDMWIWMFGKRLGARP